MASLFCIYGPMKIMAVDQARHGAYAIFDYENRTLLEYDSFNFDNRNYEFASAVLEIETLIMNVIEEKNIDYVFFEDIQLVHNVKSFKRLAQLQGVLINMCEKNNYRYGIVTPSQWQSYCKARGRTGKEIAAKVTDINELHKKASKIYSLQFVKENYGVETDNDNVADAICQATYVVNKLNLG